MVIQVGKKYYSFLSLAGGEGVIAKSYKLNKLTVYRWDSVEAIRVTSAMDSKEFKQFINKVSKCEKLEDTPLAYRAALAGFTLGRLSGVSGTGYDFISVTGNLIEVYEKISTEKKANDFVNRYYNHNSEAVALWFT